MKRFWPLLCLVLFAAAHAARAQDGAWQEDLGELTVIHGPLTPKIEETVEVYVLTVADNFAGFYPEAQYRHVRAVYFSPGSIIVCGEINKTTPGGPSGWHYFTNSGPLIFESDTLEQLCDKRTYLQQGFADEREYGPQFTEAAANSQVGPEVSHLTVGRAD